MPYIGILALTGECCGFLGGLGLCTDFLDVVGDGKFHFATVVVPSECNSCVMMDCPILRDAVFGLEGFY